MKILTVSSSAPPKNSPESLQVGKYLKYLAPHHEITLLTAQITRGWEPEDKSMLSYIENVKERIELRSLPPRLVTVIKKIYPRAFVPDDNAFFFWQLKSAIRKIKTRPDLIFSRSAPFSSAVMGLKLSEYYQVPWVMHLSDVWSDSPFYTWSATVKERQNELERKCIELADIVTLTSQKTIAFYQEKFPAMKSKFQFLPNVFDAADVNTEPPVRSEKLKFVFTGRLYGSRSIHPVLEAFEKAIQLQPDIGRKFEFIFAGFFDQENIDRINQMATPAIKYLGPLSMKEALQLQRSAHVLVLIDSLFEDPMYQLFFPSKLLDYLAAKRFVLAVTGKGSTTYEVVEGNCGKCFDASSLPELPSFIVNIVDRFMNGDTSFITIERNMDVYSAEFNAKKLMSMFEQLVESHD